MNALNAALLVNWLGFLVGVSLYALLGFMVIRYRRGSAMQGVVPLLLATAALGLIWNLGELFVFVLRSLAYGSEFPIVTAAAYSALGFLPSVVVHSAETETDSRRFLTFSAYGLSSVAALLHFAAAFSGSNVPSGIALLILTIGAVSLATLLLIFSIGQTIEKKAIWVTALLVFALSGLHFVGTPEGSSWLVELVAHQSSIPLALAILYQNYRFAFADLFLKRAISVMLLASLSFTLYVWVAAPLLSFYGTIDQTDVFGVSVILVMWMATALSYPLLHRIANWIVDKIILHRADYASFQNALAQKLETADTGEDVVEALRRMLSTVLTANRSFSQTLEAERGTAIASNIDFESDHAKVRIPTVEGPFFEVSLGDLQGGRRLMSDDVAMLESAAHIAARRIDALRVTHERCEQEFREQEFSKLATEAQLAALRAQINPHFLFNALTTIGYLIQTTPEKAFQTLIQLTKLLRGILSSTGEFCTLGDEIRLIENYLEIERARFEERLQIDIDVPDELRKINIPALILQPLVENAIKHGISERKDGGMVSISARLTQGTGSQKMLELVVSNTAAERASRKTGERVGIANVGDRLRSHFGDNAAFRLDVNDPARTHAVVTVPVRTDDVLLQHVERVTI